MNTVKTFTQPLPGAVEPATPATVVAPLVAALRNASYEVLPFRGTAETVCASVPRDVPISITMTASKGIDATLDLAATLSREGYSVTPHLAARMFAGTDEVARAVDGLRAAGVGRAFVIAGDLPEPRGPFVDALGLIGYLDDHGRPFEHIGVGGYPEGHGRIDPSLMDAALRDKSPYATQVVTQLCFSPTAIADWARTLHAGGVTTPVRIGLPGAVTRQKLVRISAGLGLGQSARFLAKQQNLLWRFLLPGGYRPDRLVRALAPQLGAVDHALSGLHLFTFNEIARTEAWRTSWLQRLAG